MREEAGEVLDAFRRIVRYLRLASRAAEVETGASAAQTFVLHQLAAGPVSSMAELARRTSTDPSSVSTVVSRLVERGLVVRRASAVDRRRVELGLSARGRAVVARSREPAQLRMLEAIEGMPTARRRALARGLGDLVRALGADDVPPKMLFEDEPAAPRTAGKRGARAT